MIYIILGPSCSGKSTLVVNTWMKGSECREFKDVLTVLETEKAYLIGKWLCDTRVKGLDRISRKQIPLIVKQVKRLIGKGKDIVLEGDKVAAGPILNELLEINVQCQLYWVKCTKETSLSRNRINGSTQKESSIKAVAQKAENIFWKFAQEMRGGIISTEQQPVWKNFSLKTVSPYYPYDKRENEKMRNDFAVFILTHGRADNVATMGALKKGGYTGKWYMIIDDEDETADQYRKNFGPEHVIMFDKQAAYDRADTMDNFNEHRAIIYARNETFRIAKELGLKYFLMLDDDYKEIDFRYKNKGKLAGKPLRRLNRVFEDMIRFLDASGALTVAFAQGGDFVGGLEGGTFTKGLLRKAMNSLFCRTDRPIDFRGTMNEDVTTYTTLGSRGKLFLTFCSACIIQIPTQSLDGGMTESYLETGTYVKTFYSVMSMPSCIKVSMMHTKHKRIHHRIDWECCVPKILNEKYRKVE